MRLLIVFVVVFVILVAVVVVGGFIEAVVSNDYFERLAIGRVQRANDVRVHARPARIVVAHEYAVVNARLDHAIHGTALEEERVTRFDLIASQGRNIILTSCDR